MGSTSPRDGTFAVHKSDVSLERSHSTSESDATLKRAYRKADVRLLVWYSFVFLILKIEGHNNANAVIMNVEAGTDIRHQLGDLTSEQWALILSICQYPNILFEPVSTLLLKRFTPRKWMSRIMISWGIISMCKGATQNFGGLLACQFLLGLAEAGFLPGVLYHLSFWYPVDRLRMRIALFYAFAQLSGAISGLLAFAISYLNGKGGLAGWRYLFLLEGMPAVLCGIYSLFSLPNYPDEVQFLNEMERVRILEKLPEAQPNAGDETWDCHQIKELFTDSTTYSFLLIWSCHAIGTKGVHHCLANRYLSARVDKYDICATHDNAALKKLKSWVAASCLEAFACVCYIILITVQNPVVKYVFVVLATTSAVGLFPILWPERIRATSGTTSAGLGIGLTSAAAGLHGIVGPQIYQPAFGPTYRVSFITSIGLGCLAIFGVLLTWAIVRRRDKRLIDIHGKERVGPANSTRVDSAI